MKLPFVSTLASSLVWFSCLQAAESGMFFKRISTFDICEQIDANCNTDVETVAETVTTYLMDDMICLIYTDSEAENLGFVDISDPTKPVADGTVALAGEPTTVRVVGDFAVVGVNTSPSFTEPSGVLSVIDIMAKEIVHDITLPGQPDAVAVSPPDATYPIYIAVAIENERDEDLGEGIPPQLPAGLVTIITIPDEDSLSSPESWTTLDVVLADMTGDACRFPEDPEPEYVDINAANTEVVVTLQENNCYVILELATGAIVNSFDAGSVDLVGIDTEEESVILQNESVNGVLREPDGVAWIGSTKYFAVANEGDMDGGSRGFSIVDSEDGSVAYDSGVDMEWGTARIGHYPEERSGNKGNEPENVYYSKFGDVEYLFVLSERSSVVFVYILTSPTTPEFLQILPVSVGPEGIATVPSKNIVAIASEVDGRGDKIRSSIGIFCLVEADAPEYPTLESVDREDGSPIPFSALSGLAASGPSTLYSIEDSFYRMSRIFTIDTSSFPASLVAEERITDSNDVLQGCLDAVEVDSSDLINDDKTVNLDPEGISVAANGGFWIVSEGRGTIGDEDRPFEYPNLLLKTTADAIITECIMLPDDGSFEPQLRFGFEGVAEYDDKVVIAIQRAWGDDAEPRIAVYNTSTGTWKYAFYPLETPLSQNGGWVGLSDISSVGNGKFLIIERDNQAGKDAAIKMICQIDLGDFSFEDGITLQKILFRDLMPDLAALNGQILEKIEGLALASDGKVWINNDNDGVDDNSGENWLLSVAEYEDPACSDDPDFRFGSTGKNSCANIAKKGPGKIKKIKKLCNKKPFRKQGDKKTRVKDICKAACGSNGFGPGKTCF